MNFLLSSFLAVPVSSTLDFLSLLLHWVFFVSTSTAAAFAELGSCCAWPPPCGGRAEVVSARLNQSHGTIDVRECAISLVLSRHNKNLKLRTLKPSACHTSQTDHVAAHEQISGAAPCYSSVLFRK